MHSQSVAVQSFHACLSPLSRKDCNEVSEDCCGLVIVMPNISVVESEVSLNNWQRNSQLKALESLSTY